jgi:hypothetical protein
MSSIFFVIKVGIITFLVVMLMQVQVGEKSLETHSHQFIIEASKKLKLNEVAVGIIQVMKEGQATTQRVFSEYWSKWQKSGSPNSPK